MSPTDVFLVSCGMGCKRITVSDIAYIEAMKDNCIIHMVDGKRYTQSCPMGGIEPELNPNMFKRIHHSFIVTIRYIDMYYYGKRQGSICHDEQVAYRPFIVQLPSSLHIRVNNIQERENQTKIPGKWGRRD